MQIIFPKIAKIPPKFSSHFEKLPRWNNNPSRLQWHLVLFLLGADKCQARTYACPGHF